MKYMFFLLSLVPLCVHAVTFDEIEIASWGYKDTKKSPYNKNICQQELTPQQDSYRAIKSIRLSKELPDSYYRFTLVKEEYADKKQAQDRISVVNNPPQSNSLISKSCNIRKGYLLNKTVYFVHTDVGVFRNELEKILDFLVQQLKE